jgi:hypothetical protein
LNRALELWQDNPSAGHDELYNQACAHAVCSTLLGPDEASQSAAHADLAIVMLRRAIGAGYDNLALIRKDPDLAPLRSRADFQLLVMDFVFPAAPFAR